MGWDIYLKKKKDKEKEKRRKHVSRKKEAGWWNVAVELPLVWIFRSPQFSFNYLFNPTNFVFLFPIHHIQHSLRQFNWSHTNQKGENMGMKQVLKNLDAFPRAEDHLLQKTQSGALGNPLFLSSLIQFWFFLCILYNFFVIGLQFRWLV